MVTKKAVVTISPEAHARLKQIAKENHAPMSVTLNQMIFHHEVRHPEEIGQITMEEITTKEQK